MKILNNYVLFIFFFLSLINNIQTRDNQIIRVTCVGDSITEGVGASDGDHAYPAQLQKILGDGFEVLNKGVSGTTVTRSDPRSYANTQRYIEGLQSHPDIVIILLGTNDITTQGIDTDEGKRIFRQDYELLVNEYQNCGSNPEIMIVPPISSVDENNNHDYRNSMNERIQIPLIDSVAQQYGLTYLDGHLYTAPWTRVDLIDGLHPSDSGYEKLAKYFANAILGYSRKFNGMIHENINYNIITKSNNKVMAIKDRSLESGAELIQDEVRRDESQYFYFVRSDDGYYQIINYHSKLYLNVYGASIEDGAKIIQYEPENTDNEKWVMEANGDGTWRITPKMARQLGLGVDNNSDESGANIVQKNFDGNDYSKWFFGIVNEVVDNPQ